MEYDRPRDLALAGTFRVTGSDRHGYQVALQRWTTDGKVVYLSSSVTTIGELTHAIDQLKAELDVLLSQVRGRLS